MSPPASRARASETPVRCRWCGDDDQYQTYHDVEWGFPVDDDQKLFEKLSLEGFQSGLSWLTILRKRENFRQAFVDFDFDRIAGWNERSVLRLLKDAGIVRHRGKIEAVLSNARLARDLRTDFGSLGAFFWSFEPDDADRPTKFDEKSLVAQSQTSESKAMSKALKKRGFRFIGPTTAYAFMQSMGIVNDHAEHCDTRAVVDRSRRRFSRPKPR
ncbi:MAG TPA: DNA-3-methyladenine glycosylase I [Myxococcales bacterium]|nr:DNA-3-methyladenine glycosylase I [Myxococcales bacterium]HIK84666.1 DNA-3-methyladenine glycosylase I [Myxococcales bacterium]